MDAPESIVEGALAEHRSMVKQMRGVPGVQPLRLEEGMEPRHCALSLVGEPIMYPEINTLLGLLHGKRISSFLVTNAQFPDAIRNLRPITQLYVSVDAATPETLKAIDRPLFADFWERFVGSLSALKVKRQRTVYRLTLVAGWNITEAGGYADLVALGEPDFIEIKGVTYCGAVRRLGAGRESADAYTAHAWPLEHPVCRWHSLLQGPPHSLPIQFPPPPPCSSPAGQRREQPDDGERALPQGRGGVRPRGRGARAGEGPGRLRARLRARAQLLRAAGAPRPLLARRRVAHVDRLREVPGADAADTRALAPGALF